MTHTFENTTLWRRTLAEQAHDPNSLARARFRQAFLKARDLVAPLVGQISAQLPSLTVHDVTHLDALWDVADLILGNDFPVNPAEAFVLGMSFLLHDAATSTAAFANGLEGVKTSIEWKDYVTQRGWEGQILAPGTPEYQAALFEVLRLLHPKQAENLLNITWVIPGGSSVYLIEDVQLRNHYGHLIGRIAHSHWWDIATVEQAWANASGVTLHSSVHVDDTGSWKVDALKIALVLRCADAAHMDSRRAPDMLAAIMKPEGISGLHWFFQNQLGLPSLNARAELYWSAGKPFAPDSATAWWLCYDTARMVDRELRATARILESNGRPAFRAKGVAGAQYIAEFVDAIPVEGWHPIDVSFKVTRVSDVIDKFGGARLYGKEPWKALRELLQNSADAVRARRAKRGIDGGRISVLLAEESGSWWLEVQDTGIGMSQYVMTEVLLDFGRSLWSDASVRKELPGLMSTGFRPIGQFGIGFLSVFMLGDEVNVTSWRDGEAEDRQSTLQVRDGTSARPVLVATPPEERIKEFGTKVRVRLRHGPSSLLPEVNSFLSSPGRAKVYLTIEQLVAALVPTIDIDVYVQSAALTLVVTADDWKALDGQALMKRIAPRSGIESSQPLFNVVEPEGSLVGRLGHCGKYYSLREGFGAADAVLTHKGILVGELTGLRGVLLAQNNFDLARRGSRPICSRAALESWACAAREVNLKTEWTHRIEIHRLLSLGLPSGEIPISQKAPMSLSPQAIRDWIEGAGFSELFVLTREIGTPEHISEKHFSEGFMLSENVVKLGDRLTQREKFGLEDWISVLVPEDDAAPRTTVGVLLKHLTEAFPGAEIEDGEFVVGTIDGEDIEAACIRISGLAD